MNIHLLNSLLLVLLAAMVVFLIWQAFKLSRPSTGTRIKYCSKCRQAIYFMSGEFCDNCGEPTATAFQYHCPNQHTVTDTDKFCEICGEQVNLNEI